MLFRKRQDLSAFAGLGRDCRLLQGTGVSEARRAGNEPLQGQFVQLQHTGGYELSEWRGAKCCDEGVPVSAVFYGFRERGLQLGHDFPDRLYVRQVAVTAGQVQFLVEHCILYKSLIARYRVYDSEYDRVCDREGEGDIERKFKKGNQTHKKVLAI